MASLGCRIRHDVTLEVLFSSGVAARGKRWLMEWLDVGDNSPEIYTRATRMFSARSCYPSLASISATVLYTFTELRRQLGRKYISVSQGRGRVVLNVL